MILQSELVSILNGVFGHQGRLRKGGSQITYHCPMCPDKNLITQKLEVSLMGPTTGYFHCWRCNFRGKSFGSLLKKLNASRHYRDAIFKLTGDIRLSRHQEQNDMSSFVSLPDEFHPIIKPKASPEYKNAVAYLKRRGILQEDIIRYNIGYCENGPYEQHIIIPSYDAKGALNFFMGRRYYTDDPGIPHKKPDVPMSEIIGFESFINYSEPLNLCEGVFDALTIRTNAVPLFGKFLSRKLREAMLINGTTRVNMVLDDDAMEDSVKNCKMMMRLGIDVYLVHLNGKDPSAIGFEKVHALIREAKQFTEDDLLRHALQL